MRDGTVRALLFAARKTKGEAGGDALSNNSNKTTEAGEQSDERGRQVWRRDLRADGPACRLPGREGRVRSRRVGSPPLRARRAVPAVNPRRLAVTRRPVFRWHRAVSAT